MCGGGSFLGNIGSTIADTVSAPFENTADALVTAFTEPDKLTLGDAAALVVPGGGALVADAINNPSHAVAQAAIVGAAVGGASLLGGSGASASAIGADGYALAGAHQTVLPTLTMNAGLEVAATTAAGGGGGGLLSTLGAASLLSTLTSAGQKAGGLISMIPGASSVVPQLLGISKPSTSGAVVGAGGINDAAIPATAGQKRNQLLLGAAVIGVPAGLVAWYGWKWYKGRR